MLEKKLPIDILNKVNKDFNSVNQLELKLILNEILSSRLNVGHHQLIRSLLYLSEGKINNLKNIYIPMMNLDPRDVVMSAEEKAGLPGHYFSISFDEMNANENLVKKEFEELDDDRLPF